MSSPEKPVSAELHRLMTAGIAHQLEGRLGEATAIYEQVLVRQPDFAAALHNLGVIALAQMDLSRAIAMIDRARLLAPQEPEIVKTLRNLGMTLYRNNFWEQARPRLAQALNANLRDEEVRQVLARIGPRDYLAPEVYCHARGETLQRYSPRESHTYIYAIDIVGTCNLRCPTCPVGNFGEANRKRGFMPVELFAAILEKIARENVADKPELFLFNWGEPLLHPRLAEILALAHGYDYPVMLSTNLNIRTDLEPVVRAKPAVLKVSLSGFTPETYRQTHVRGNLERVKANLLELRTLLDRHKSTTRVYVGHHIYRHNADQIASVREFCAGLGFEHAPIQAFFQPLEKVKAVIEGKLDSMDLPVLDLLQLHPRERFERLRETRPGGYDCELRFNQTVINHDGSVALCCGVYEAANMLGADFLGTSHEELERRKYAHPFCKTCKQFEMDYSPNHVPVGPTARQSN